jgi:asparagine synthase (glutamine-hydrolysing)
LRLKHLNNYYFKVFSRLDRISIREIKWYNFYNKYISLSNNNIQKLADVNIKLWLEGDSNVKVDRASKAYAVEVRSPFLDYRIVEFARSLPVKYRYDNGIKKKLLKDILKEYIPEEIFNKPKKGFSVPIGDWLRNELKEDLLKTLTNDFLDSVLNLNVEIFKNQLDNHLKGKSDYSHNIWKMYVLAIWYQTFEELKKNSIVK